MEPTGKTPNRKITVHVPAGLLGRAQDATGEGITETVRRGLRLVAARDAYDRLRKLRGKVQLDSDMTVLREDRD